MLIWARTKVVVVEVETEVTQQRGKKKDQLLLPRRPGCGTNQVASQIGGFPGVEGGR